MTLAMRWCARMHVLNNHLEGRKNNAFPSFVRTSHPMLFRYGNRTTAALFIFKPLILLEPDYQVRSTVLRILPL
uniref:Uncharacterized protein n=1 Tax=Anguilla anguilla TaxID=7936 RepID=A0A0E9QCF9_ANGAN